MRWKRSRSTRYAPQRGVGPPLTYLKEPGAAFRLRGRSSIPTTARSVPKAAFGHTTHCNACNALPPFALRGRCLPPQQTAQSRPNWFRPEPVIADLRRVGRERASCGRTGLMQMQRNPRLILVVLFACTEAKALRRSEFHQSGRSSAIQRADSDPVIRCAVDELVGCGRSGRSPQCGKRLLPA